jgi:hypothetical protein
MEGPSSPKEAQEDRPGSPVPCQLDELGVWQVWQEREMLEMATSKKEE